MKGLLFFAFLPALIALGHDAYLYYNNQELGFMFADLGFIWTTYHPDSYKEVVRFLDTETWSTVSLFLTLEAFYAGLVFATIVLLTTGIFKLLKKFSAISKPSVKRVKGTPGTVKRDTIQKFQYKRK